MSPTGRATALRNRVREIRLKRGLTQEALGEAVGLTRQSVIAIEKGRFTPSVYTALKLADALGATVEELFWIRDKEE